MSVSASGWQSIEHVCTSHLSPVGAMLGDVVGKDVGALIGWVVGRGVGESVGSRLGRSVGVTDGAAVYKLHAPAVDSSNCAASAALVVPPAMQLSLLLSQPQINRRASATTMSRQSAEHAYTKQGSVVGDAVGREVGWADGRGVGLGVGTKVSNAVGAKLVAVVVAEVVPVVVTVVTSQSLKLPAPYASIMLLSTVAVLSQPGKSDVAWLITLSVSQITRVSVSAKREKRAIA